MIKNNNNHHNTLIIMIHVILIHLIGRKGKSVIGIASNHSKKSH